ncbi:GGDEF domain-containing phosphodiesterase [Thalassotalea marina]|uniref:GGDEF domain-containing protein n=1 Tax=Thalassotalea marina TaxID=1673741 RepID=A0A919EH35_9GAMM|nr:GGDEF domain-containing phosphodiesterase [Thalassotalea marina]GHF82311.1 hypothetical protein GCM10017161_06860 [Thalassotalea marina]
MMFKLTLKVLLSLSVMSASLSAYANVQGTPFNSGSFIWPFILGALAVIIPIAIAKLYHAFNKRTNNKLQSEQGVKVKPSGSHIALDAVTNLPVMKRGIDVLEKCIGKNSAQHYVAIAFKPINFEHVNNVLGHQNSDILLLQLAYKIQQKLEQHALLLNFGSKTHPLNICRLQGLDFVIVADRRQFKHEDKYVLDDICLQVTKSLPNSLSFKNFSLSFRLAFGIALGSEKHNATQLFSEASDALSLAEREQQQIWYFDEQSKVYTAKRLAKMEKLRLDIQENRLCSMIQPQVVLNTGELVGFEVNTKWKSSDGDVIEKKAFEAIAEFSGVIYQITKQLIRDALIVAKIANTMQENIKVGINLSSKDLLEPELADFIEQEANQHGIELKQLVIELDESVILTDTFRARMMIDQLRALGVNIAVDNFSGSYESLKYLRKASIQQVKIDCHHLNDKDIYQADKTIASALINLIRKMDIPVIAIGINNSGIREHYMSVGGEIGQGKLIHQGLTTNELQSWLDSRNVHRQAN